MKAFILCSLLFALPVFSQQWVTDYSTLLEKYAAKNGVNYKKLKSKDSHTLKAITDGIATSAPSGSPAEQLAFYLNAYNAWMLKKAVDAYPTDSLLNNDKDIYKRNDIVIAGKRTSLDTLENQVIRKQFKDARIHFALNCASKGCPPLHDEAFTGENLDSLLHQLTSTFLNSSRGVQEKGSTLAISKLFEWFATDFKRDSGSIIGYLKKYRKISGTPSVSYLDYSWELNDN